MHRFLAAALAVLFVPSTLSAASSPVDAELRAAAIERWEKDIRALEALDRTEQHPKDSILFVGSSSIRGWKTIGRDVFPYHPIQRGYGGSKFSDVAVFAERLIRPHAFRALAIFVGNDVSGRADDATPEQVRAWFGHIVEVAQQAQPDAAIFCIEITPTPSRWAAWPKIQEVNRVLARECAARPRVHFIPTAHAYLGLDGEPLADLFVEDRLHLNELGYRIWSAIIKSHLDAQLDPAIAGGQP